MAVARTSGSSATPIKDRWTCDCAESKMGSEICALLLPTRALKITQTCIRKWCWKAEIFIQLSCTPNLSCLFSKRLIVFAPEIGRSMEALGWKAAEFRKRMTQTFCALGIPAHLPGAGHLSFLRSLPSLRGIVAIGRQRLLSTWPPFLPSCDDCMYAATSAFPSRHVVQQLPSSPGCTSLKLKIIRWTQDNLTFLWICMGQALAAFPLFCLEMSTALKWKLSSLSSFHELLCNSGIMVYIGICLCEGYKWIRGTTMLERACPRIPGHLGPHHSFRCHRGSLNVCAGGSLPGIFAWILCGFYFHIPTSCDLLIPYNQSTQRGVKANVYTAKAHLGHFLVFVQE